jgi:sugar phosphate isomerase/epimerase
MRIGLMVQYSKKEVDFLSSVGFGSCELLVGPGQALDPAVTSKDDIMRAKDLLAERDIKVSAIAHHENHLHPDKATRTAHNEHFKRLMDLALMMDVDTVCTFAGRDPEKGIADNMPAFKEIWTPMAKMAEDKDLKIGFENCPMFYYFPFRGTNIAYTPVAWDMMFDAVPSDALGIEWDPSHLICLLIDPYQNILDYGDKIVSVHAKDGEVDWNWVHKNGWFEEGAVAHRTPGMGVIDWNRVVSNLTKVGYRGNLDIEGRHDLVFKGDLEDQGVVFSYNHLLQAIGGKQDLWTDETN